MFTTIAYLIEKLFCEEQICFPLICAKYKQLKPGELLEVLQSCSNNIA